MDLRSKSGWLHTCPNFVVSVSKHLANNAPNSQCYYCMMWTLNLWRKSKFDLFAPCYYLVSFKLWVVSYLFIFIFFSEILSFSLLNSCVLVCVFSCCKFGVGKIWAAANFELLCSYCFQLLLVLAAAKFFLNFPCLVLIAAKF